MRVRQMFTGLTSSHFDAYRREKWRSRAFNLERMAVKEQLGALGGELAAVLSAAGDLTFDIELSTEYPALWNQKQVDAQHLYFARPPCVRRDIERVVDRARGMAALIEDSSHQRSHVVLLVSVAVDHVFAGLKLHRDAAVDRDNLASQLTDPARARDLMARLAHLPAHIELGIDAQCVKPAASGCPGTLSALLERLDAPLLPGHSRWLTVGQRTARDLAIELGRDLAGHIERVLLDVLPIYRYIAWAPDNDHIALRERLRECKAAAVHRGLRKSDTVRVTAGIFAGRTGVIQDIDSKGTVKVLIGSIPIRLDADILVKK